MQIASGAVAEQNVAMLSQENENLSYIHIMGVRSVRYTGLSGQCVPLVGFVRLGVTLKAPTTAITFVLTCEHHAV